MNLLIVFFGWVVIGAFLILRYRDAIIRLVPERFPALLGYFVIATPFMFIEEAFTCDQATYTQCVPRVLPSFWVLLTLLFITQRYTSLSWRPVTWIYGVMGCIGEFFIVGRVWQATFLQLVILVPLCILIYRVMAIPSAYWLHRKLHRSG